MIIDCHSHVWPGMLDLGPAERLLAAGADCSATGQYHLEATEPADVTFVLGFMSDYLGVEIPNDYVAQHVSTHGGRMLGFAGVDPTRKECVAQIRQWGKSGNFAGLTISPACQNMHPCDTRAMRVYGLAEELGLPVVFMQGERLPRQAILEFANPVHLDEVARTFGGLKIVVSHLGYPWVEQTIALLDKNENVYANVAGLGNKPWQAYRSLTLAYEYGVTDKLLFASGFPCQHVKAAVEALYNLNKLAVNTVLPAVPREMLRGIVERDSLTLLGLPGGTETTGRTAAEMAQA